jgi:mannose-6-phosphate isomerase-like protein (cupin superfamily)
MIMVEDLDKAIEEYRAEGYRLDMIFPADSPREALMSAPSSLPNGKEANDPASVVRLQAPPAIHAGGSSSVEWHTGRAGMMYRDLIPDRLAGKVIASHIKLLNEGPVADHVHFHKVDFQMIYCLRGRIRVVYEDQGPPFWLETGDCVVQPPEIRHRVLECTAGAEVLEVTFPAEHETWIDHDFQLPNSNIDRDRLFNGQKFVLTRSGTS